MTNIDAHISELAGVAESLLAGASSPRSLRRTLTAAPDFRRLLEFLRQHPSGVRELADQARAWLRSDVATDREHEFDSQIAIALIALIEVGAVGEVIALIPDLEQRPHAYWSRSVATQALEPIARTTDSATEWKGLSGTGAVLRHAAETGSRTAFITKLLEADPRDGLESANLAWVRRSSSDVSIVIFIGHRIGNESVAWFVDRFDSDQEEISTLEMVT